MIHAELKRLHSPDVFDLEHHQSQDEEPFSILIQAMFGPKDAEGEESFDLVVCNTKSIDLEVKENGLLDGRHHLVMHSFDVRLVRDFLSKAAKESTGATWEEVATKLGRIGRWEFEDYEGQP